MTRDEFLEKLDDFDFDSFGKDDNFDNSDVYEVVRFFANKIYDDLENINKQEEKDCPTCYHLGDNDYCEYCIRGEGYSKDYWELKV